eukprot:2349201-Amphidinium_carterae.4
MGLPGLPPPTTDQSAPVSVNKGRKLKIPSVLDQRSEGEVKRLNMEKVNELFTKCRAGRGARPHLDVELTIDQMSAVHQVVKEGAAPHVDFPVFGPRYTRKLHHVAYFLQPDSSWKRAEVPGPPDF